MTKQRCVLQNLKAGIYPRLPTILQEKVQLRQLSCARNNHYYSLLNLGLCYAFYVVNCSPFHFSFLHHFFSPRHVARCKEIPIVRCDRRGR